MIVSRLLYSLSSDWLNVAEIRRLNGFQARCLRCILHIKAAFYSRISNVNVLAAAGQTLVGRQLLRQQLSLYGRVARAPRDDYLRKLTFTSAPGSLQPLVDKYIRRRGRPRNEWTRMVQRESWRMHPDADRLVHDLRRWHSSVEQYCK